MNHETDKSIRIDVAEVVLDPRHAGPNHLLTYRNPQNAKPGDVVLAPLGTRQMLGVVVTAGPMAAHDLMFDAGKLKNISGGIDGLRLPDHALKLSEWLAETYATTLGSAAHLFVMPTAQDYVQTRLYLDRTPDSEDSLSPAQSEVVRILEESNGSIEVIKGKTLPPALVRAVRALKEKGIVSESFGLKLPAERSGLPSTLRLITDQGKVERYLAGPGKKRPAQALVLMRLLEAPIVNFAPEEIKVLCNVSDATIKALLKLGYLVEPAKNEPALASAPKLNEEQQQAADAITEAIEAGRADRFLLYGITGSGKTEVYLRAAASALALGKQVLYLVPEIALTAQAIGQLRSRFGDEVCVLHSSLGASERRKTYQAISEGRMPLILGPRSALFAPIKNLGLIIMDEEHEGSYKQEANPRYHAKHVARELGRLYNAPLVLGSATPSIETYYESEHGEVRRLELKRRATGALLPEVELLSLSEMYREGGVPSPLSPALRDAIQHRLEAKQQSVLFLNRRAYSPIMGCRDCGHVIACDSCSVALSYHKRSHRLICHYCDMKRAVPDVCPSCGGERLRPLGMGTEKVEEAVKEAFPEAKVARLDRDVARKKGALEEIITQMRSGEIDILIGTQMVAKGLDFPNVTLVGVVLADTSLHLPDFRAAERTFQLLTQVSGRSGRGSLPGEVLVQTFDTLNPVIQLAQKHDYDTFYRIAVQEREAATYPPFCRLVNITISGESNQKVEVVSNRIGSVLRQGYPEAIVLGPARCPIERLKNQWRTHLLMKCPQNESLSDLKRLVELVDAEGTTIVIDVDPQSML